MIKNVIPMLFFVFYFLPSYSQEIRVIEGDTLVTIIPEQVGKINKTYEELKWIKKEILLKDSIIVGDQTLITLNQKLAEEKIKTTKKKARRTYGIIGLIVGFILGGVAL